ncbi:hypothetical protein PG630_10130 [Riemerella anatipestifer]|nr:hypothetical protein [Riemerella anatipestifer]
MNQSVSIEGKSNAFLDASENISKPTNIGKGLLFPQTDLSTFKLDLASADGINYPTYFDGMIVYNTKEGGKTSDPNIQVTDNLQKGFYYFSNPTGKTSSSIINGKWVRIGDSVSQEGQEWVYNPTNKRIELKRSGTTPFTNKVYYDENGGLKNLDFESYDSYNPNTNQWQVNIPPLSKNDDWQSSSSIEGVTGQQNGLKTKYKSEDILLLDDQPYPAGISPTNKSYNLITKKGNKADYQWMQALYSLASHQGDGDAKWLIANSATARATQGTSSGYIVGNRAQVLTNISSANEVNSYMGSVYIGANSQTISAITGGDLSSRYFENARPTVITHKGISTSVYLDIGANPNIENAYGFRYKGFWGEGTATIGKHYGLYLDNINKGNENYAIYTNAGKVHFGDEVNVVGSITATSIKGSNGATIFPDYVFQKYYTGTSSLKADYSFKTLSQVEDFVKTNGHLPGYKSAAEIKKQGYIDLMATQLTNVEKIEELYLHLLEKDKEVKALKAEITELKSLVKDLLAK